MVAVRLRDVAERAGVSVKTASNVINNYPHIKPSTRERVEAAIARAALPARTRAPGSSSTAGPASSPWPCRRWTRRTSPNWPPG